MFYPGQLIATSEEAQPARGTVEENGNIYAALVGENKMHGGMASIANPRTPRMLQRGDLIYASVADVFDQVALLEFKPAEKHVVSGEDRAFLRIMEVQERSKGYVESFYDFIRIGDVLKAKIIEVTPLGVYATIAAPGLGVIRAYCGVCRKELSEKLECAECGRRERRKTP